jgi:hypothetical protein
MPGTRSLAKVLCRGALFLGLLIGMMHTDVALAYWNTGGTGTGTAKVAQSYKPLRINQTAQLAPVASGQAAQTLSGDFDNLNGDAVPVKTVRVSIAAVAKAPGAAAGTCDAGDFTLGHRVMTVGADVPSGRQTGRWSGATIAFNNKPGVNQNGCMGATVKLGYTTAA